MSEISVTDHLFSFKLTGKLTFLSDVAFLVLLFASSFISVYFFPVIVSSVFFLLLIPVFIFTKKDYFWFAFFFIISSAPANIFAGSSFDTLYRLPSYSIFFGKITVIDLFVIGAFFKSLYVYFKERHLKIKKEILYSIIYIAIVTLAVSFIYGSERQLFFRELRGASFLSVIFSFTTLIKSTKEVKKFAYILIPFLFLVLADQLSIIFLKDLLIKFFRSDISIRLVTDNLSGNSRAISTSFYLVLLCMFFGLFFYNKKNEKAVLILLTISPIIIIITSIRMWTVSLLLLGGIYILLSEIPLKKYIKIIIPLIIIFLFLNLFSDFRNYFNETIIVRFTSLFTALSKGELTNYDSLAPRLADTKRIIDAIFFAPLFGSGLSHVYLTNKSGDLGFLNFILFAGVSGGIILLTLVLRILINLFRIIRSSTEKRKAIALFSFYCAIIIPYLTTINFFAFDVPSIILFSSILISVTQIFFFENENILKPV